MSSAITHNNLNHWQAGGQFISVAEHKIFTRVIGQGKPILMLHGFPTASFDYVRLVPLLEDGFRLVLLDFLGFGFSDKPAQHTYSLFEQADIVQAVANHYGIERATVVTHDMGNSVTLEILRRGQLEIEKLVMLNGSVLLRYYRPLMTQRLLLNPLTGPLITRFHLINRNTFARQFGSLFAHFPPDEEIDAFWSLIRHNNGMDIYHLLIRYLNERKLHEYDWLDALQVHQVPLTLIWGQRDPVSVPKIAEAVLERRPDAIYVPLADVSHYPHWELPEQVAQVIREQL
ncbi:MAG: alpha/beta hydrolase [Anaerolineae bacterium]